MGLNPRPDTHQEVNTKPLSHLYILRKTNFFFLQEARLHEQGINYLENDNLEKDERRVVCLELRVCCRTVGGTT